MQATTCHCRYVQASWLWECSHLDFHIDLSVNMSIHTTHAIAGCSRSVLGGHHHGLGQAPQLQAACSIEVHLRHSHGAVAGCGLMMVLNVCKACFPKLRTFAGDLQLARSATSGNTLTHATAWNSMKATVVQSEEQQPTFSASKDLMTILRSWQMVTAPSRSCNMHFTRGPGRTIGRRHSLRISASV